MPQNETMILRSKNSRCLGLQPVAMSVAALLVAALLVAAGVWQLLIPAAHADETFTTKWAQYEEARQKAEKSRYGMVFYFPPVAALDKVHDAFTEEELAMQSLKSPMVRILEKPQHKKLRQRYKVSPKYFVVVVTDYYGNAIGKPFKAKSPSQKLPAAQIIKLIQTADNFVDQKRMSFEKSIEKAERNFEKKRWRSAIKEYAPIAAFNGLKVSDRARKRLAEIVEIGNKAIDNAKQQSDPKKALKKVAKEFKGCEVEELVEKALAEVD